MSIDEKALRALCDKASPGPWLVSRQRNCIDTGMLAGNGEVWDGYSIHPRFAVEGDEEDAAQWEADRAFIAAARTALPTLLDELARTRAQLDEATATLAAIRRVVTCQHLHPEGTPLHVVIAANQEAAIDLDERLRRAERQLDEARERLAPAAWRKAPPTVEEVKACPWWWCDDGDPRPMRLTVNEFGRVVEVVDGHEIPVEEMEAEWAPCVRPGGAGLVEAARSLDALTAARSPSPDLLAIARGCRDYRFGNPDDLPSIQRGVETVISALEDATGVQSRALERIGASPPGLVEAARNLADALDAFDALAESDEDGAAAPELRRMDRAIIDAQYRVRDALRAALPKETP